MACHNSSKLIFEFWTTIIQRNLVLYIADDSSKLIIEVALFGGQLRINFLSKILKFFCNIGSDNY